jgi:hypothetical protein
MAPVGGAEDLLSGVTGFGAQIPAGLAGLGTTLASALHLTNADPADVVNAVKQKLTYSPVSASGKAGQQEMSDLTHPITQAVGTQLDKLGPGAATAIPAILQAAASTAPLAGGLSGLGSSLAEGADAATTNGLVGPGKGALPDMPTTTNAAADARGAGFVMRPQQVKASVPANADNVPGTFREAISGSTELKQQANMTNTANATKLAGRQLGLGPNTTEITPEDLSEAEAPHAQVYDELGHGIGNIEPGSTPQLNQSLQDALDDTTVRGALQPAPARAVRNIQQSLANGTYDGDQLVSDIGTLRRANNGRPVADALEQELGRQVAPEDLEDYEGARRGFAQINAVRDSLSGTQVDPQHFAQLEQSSPGLLTGGLKQIGQAAMNFPDDVALPGSSTSSSVAGANTKTSMIGRGVHAIARSMANPLGENFQNENFGRVMTPTEDSYSPDFGRPPEPPSAAPQPPPARGPGGEQLPLLGQRLPIGSLPQPGSVGPLPSTAPTTQPGMLGSELGLAPPPGSVGPMPPRPPQAPIPLNQEQLRLNTAGDPLTLTAPPGSAGPPPAAPGPIPLPGPLGAGPLQPEEVSALKQILGLGDDVAGGTANQPIDRRNVEGAAPGGIPDRRADSPLAKFIMALRNGGK